MSAHQTHIQSHGAPSEQIALVPSKTESRIDSRVLSAHLGNRHKAVMALIERYAEQFKGFGQLPFQKEVGERTHGGGNPERFALLNEDQAFFLLSLSRNSEPVVKLKAKLVQAFREARQLVDQHRFEYLPTYHRLHEEVHAMSAGSSNRHFVHANINKLVNKTAGIEAGQRRSCTDLPQQAMLILAQAVATNALQGAVDHHEGYQRVKLCLHALAAVTAPKAQVSHQEPTKALGTVQQGQGEGIG
jgi:phage regulator Rha-like protein